MFTWADSKAYFRPMTMEQIERELKAIEQFDTLFLLEEEHTAESMVGFRRRQQRKRELLALAQDPRLANLG